VAEHVELAAFFAKVSQELLAQPDTELTFDRVAQRAVEVVPACNFVGITLREKDRCRSVATTSPAADLCDELQYELNEGPCLDAVSEDEAYLIEDVANDPRWPRWGPRAAEAGAGSILSVRLADDRNALGALNMYAHEPGAFDNNSIDLGLVFASHAATAVSAANLVTGLHTALQSRHLIGAAQGVLMAKHDLTLEASFEVLRRYSNDTNLPLREVARLVVEDRALPLDYSQVLRLQPGNGVAMASD
jgi:transcriptional regulator with GAF, ATPase, and Fis domain